MPEDPGNLARKNVRSAMHLAMEPCGGGTLFHMEKEVIVERDQAAHMCSGERTGWRISILQAEYQLVPSWLLKYALAIS